jgi:hypothetical protein
MPTKIKKRVAIFASEDLRHDTLNGDVLPDVLRGFCVNNFKATRSPQFPWD